MSSIWDWSTTAGNNANADSSITWAEGQAPSTVNNSARVMMQRVKELLNDIGGVVAAGGTANSLTVAAASPFTAYADGLRISFRAVSDNNAAMTLNVNAIGSKPLVKVTAAGETAIVAGEVQADGIYEAVYSEDLNSASGAWLLLNPAQIAVSAFAATLLDDADATAAQATLSVPPTSRTITAGNGLTGGGNLSSNRTITLGTPETCTPTSTNSVTATSHVHDITDVVGVDQSWSAPSRTAGTSYQNTTGSAIQVIVNGQEGGNVQVSTNNSTWITLGSLGGSDRNCISFIVPNNHYYRVTSSGWSNWSELR